MIVLGDEGWAGYGWKLRRVTADCFMTDCGGEVALP